MNTGITIKHRWRLDACRTVAERLVDRLAPACERITIAGSVRRARPDPADIELLCVPRMDYSLIFGADLLDAAVKQAVTDGILLYRVNSKGQQQYGPMNKFMADLATGIPIDIFSTDAPSWGMALVVRTGPAELNIRMMSRLKAMGYKGFIYGIKNRQGQECDVETEEKVFALLGWTMTEPSARK